jgi:hypothetical protein
MDGIHLANDSFQFQNISLAVPTGIQGGAYFTKILCQEKSLYIETPKCLTKQGFIKNGKKICTDLMFDHNDEEFIHWIEKLESRCHQLIYENGDSWFQNKLELDDIESAFTSPLKIYKSGKYYLLRVNVKMNYSTNYPHVKIYNESETPLTIDDVTAETTIISIIEIQGIKFTSKNFQIEIELKQSMVLNSEKIFEQCLIKKKREPAVLAITKREENVVVPPPVLEEIREPVLVKEEVKEEKQEKEEVKEEIIAEDVNSNSEQEEEDDTEGAEDTGGEEKDKIIIQTEAFTEEPLVEIDEFPETESKTELELTEYDPMESATTLETMTLKKPNQVYYEIYKEARKKAKDAKKAAILAFLEAKNIKKTYILEDLDESDDEVDDYSDSDLNEFSELI